MTPEHDALARLLIALPSWTATGPTISPYGRWWRSPDGILWRKGLRPRADTWLPCLEDAATGGVILDRIGGSNAQEAGGGGWEVNGKGGDTLAEAAGRALLEACS